VKREKAFREVAPYPCIGHFRFLDLSISLHALYPKVLSRLKTSSQTLLDLGCCFGQDIRRLVVDGAPAENLYGADLHPEFLELGYDLFKDKDKLKAHFLLGDVFDDESEGKRELKKLDGKIDIIHAASFIHLFGWDDQVRVGVRMVRLLKPDATDSLILGRQAGITKAGIVRDKFRHDPESFQKLWDAVGEQTGTKWKVKADLQMIEGWEERGQSELREDGKETRAMQFEVHRAQ